MPSAYRRSLPLLVLFAGLLVTLLTATALHRAERGRQDARLAAVADGATGAIQARMLAQLTLLRGTAGFFNASAEVEVREFSTFVERLRLEQNYPGLLGIGFAAYATNPALLAEAARRTGRDPGFRVWPARRASAYSAIILLEPLNRLNRQALGYDMLSEPTRRAAMLEAVRTNKAAMSGRVRLVQEIEPVKQPGFLLYLPITDERGELHGWVYSPLRAWDLFRAILADRDLEKANVEIFDGQIGEPHLLYRSGARIAEPAQVAVRRIAVAGRPWIVRISKSGSGTSFILAGVAAVGGAVSSLLLALLLLQQDRAAARVERQVAERTGELSLANEQMRLEAQAREAAEAQVRQMQKMEAVGQLTGGIAHDFNNMLAVVIGNLELAARRVDEPERVAQAIEGAMRGAERAAELTQRLLAYGRRQSLAPRLLDANALIEGMSELLRRSLGETIRLESRLAEGLWPIHADPVQLESAILNVAINGRDAMPEGGSLSIETANRHVGPEDKAAGGAPAPGDYVLIAIADSGHGMTEEVAARALEPFFTTKEVGKGTGLGLSQVYGFVRQSGGHFGLVTAPGGGTRVQLFLPRSHAAEPGALPRSENEDAIPLGREAETILVVEDEPRVREMSVEALRELGYGVLAAEGGAEALDLLERHHEISLVFTDMVMPGISGRQLADAVGKLWPHLPILFTTGFARETIAEGQDGIALLRKPFTAAQLARKIREALDG